MAYHGLFNAKAIIVEQQRYDSTHSWRNKRVHAFPKIISVMEYTTLPLSHVERLYIYI